MFSGICFQNVINAFFKLQNARYLQFVKVLAPTSFILNNTLAFENGKMFGHVGNIIPYQLCKFIYASFSPRQLFNNEKAGRMRQCLQNLRFCLKKGLGFLIHLNFSLVNVSYL